MTPNSRYVSPLRYPGGKARLAPYFARVLAAQATRLDTYCEPYAGGAGAGLQLLLDGYVSRVIINDLNPGIAAFWRATFTQTEDLIERILTTAVNLDVWHRQRIIYQTPDRQNSLDLAFATFFLNRTNRSGILSARPIGGLEQTGRWLIDARYNKSDLAGRIRRLGALSDRVTVREERAISLVRTLNKRKKPILMYVDPPYVVAGEELYMTAHSWREHGKLEDILSKSPHPWILTYDADPRTRILYEKYRCLQFGISHTAQVQKIGTEFMFFSKGLRIPDVNVVRTKGSWVSSRDDS